jgi:hypothetical protein
MQNPLIARELREKGVDELLSKPLNPLSGIVSGCERDRRGDVLQA